MSIVVQKYGGSSVADVPRIKQVAARIARTREAGDDVCVVVSAMGKTTDQLLERARQISESPMRRELDMLLTCGERASMALLSMAVAELGYEAISFTGSQSGILTNDRHSGARIIEVRPIRIEDELARGKVVIVAGFQGVSYKREITTLGRGGSDTTAVALAAALGAVRCEICSDVDGVFSADPRICTAAELCEAITHDQMLELAAHGAVVLHPECVELARRSGIALYARSTTGSGGGTRIDRPERVSKADVVGVSGERGLVRLVATGAGAASTLLEALADAGVTVKEARATAEAMTAVCALDDVPDWPAVKAKLAAGLGEVAVAIDEDIGAVSVVGDLAGADPKLLDGARRAAQNAGVAVTEMVSSPLRATFYCRAEDTNALVTACHQALVE
ncbi:MAG TPA: aspartate kinase [Kofleriaceae bacterium]|nr:aspartate kinase [Kofleriaceae bacterium]